MYLARAFLNPASRAVRADLADAAGLHRTVMRAFPDDAGPDARKTHGVLHRLDEDIPRGRFVLFVQSAAQPDFTRLPDGYFLDLRDDLDLDGPALGDNPAVREVTTERARIVAGDRFAFRLRANTTKKIPKLDAQTGARTKNGKRVPVTGDPARLAWLERHAAAAGFRVEGARVTELPPRRSHSRDVAFAGALFEGTLVVADADAFRAALADGIGPGKAFGFGLLSIQRARS